MRIKIITRVFINILRKLVCVGNSSSFHLDLRKTWRQLQNWSTPQTLICNFLLISISILFLNCSKKTTSNEVLIPSGWFWMGTSEEQIDQILQKFPDYTKPEDFNREMAHHVYIDSFYIDKYEVTNEQFAKFVALTGYIVRGNWRAENADNARNYPVSELIWDDAVAYADWVGKRLPTEAEWEKAARGGLEGKLYPWGDKWDADKCNNVFLKNESLIRKRIVMLDNPSFGPLPVGSFKPNGYGLYDMAGNVSEWCSDWFHEEYYSASPNSNPQGPPFERYRYNKVLRGGSWLDRFPALDMRCADRSYFQSNIPVPTAGIRLVRDVSKTVNGRTTTKLNRLVSEKLITEVDFFSLIPNTITISQDVTRFAYVTRIDHKLVVVVDGKNQKSYSGILEGSLCFSPDSKHIAYVARQNEQWFVARNGEEMMKYNKVGPTLIFSPDSKRLAYAAQLDKQFVVVDKEEGERIRLCWTSHYHV